MTAINALALYESVHNTMTVKISIVKLDVKNAAS